MDSKENWTPEEDQSSVAKQSIDDYGFYYDPSSMVADDQSQRRYYFSFSTHDSKTFYHKHDHFPFSTN